MSYKLQNHIFYFKMLKLTARKQIFYHEQSLQVNRHGSILFLEKVNNWYILLLEVSGLNNLESFDEKKIYFQPWFGQRNGAKLLLP